MMKNSHFLFSFSMNCRCKKDKSGEMQCHLKTQPRLKLKSLIRKECDGRKVISLEYFLQPYQTPYNNDRATSRIVSELYNITLKMSLNKVELTSNDFKCLNLIFIRR